ncbi:MAG: type II secretion system protein [Nitrospirae bacterium]|nr:type II secretion system protein [Nitrospirota bacterium]
MLRKNGFTLLEVLVSLAIVSGLLVTVIHSLNYNLSIVERQKDVAIAVMLAREKLAQYNATGITEEKGSFGKPFDDFDYELKSYASTLPQVVVMELSVSKKENVKREKLAVSRKLYMKT